MDNLTGMAVFAKVVEAKSFSEAARQLGLSKSAVGKKISRLEPAPPVMASDTASR